MIRRLFGAALSFSLITCVAFAAPAATPVTTANPAPVVAPAIPSGQYPVVDGSTATLPLSYALRAACTGETLKQAQAQIRHSKTTQSFYTLADGGSDLLLVYEPSADAYAYAAYQGVDLLMKPIGRDALVFLVNAGNPVATLTDEQVVGIYSGAIANWKDVGGGDLSIVAYQRSDDSGSQVMMKKQVMKDVALEGAPAQLKPDEMGELIDEVSSYVNEPSAVGYSVYYYVHNMYIQDNIRIMPIGGVAPDNDTIASGQYPYTQDFYAVIRADAPEDSPQRLLFDWLGGEDAAQLLTGAGYVPLVGKEIKTVAVGE